MVAVVLVVVVLDVVALGVVLVRLGAVGLAVRIPRKMLMRYIQGAKYQLKSVMIVDPCHKDQKDEAI